MGNIRVLQGSMRPSPTESGQTEPDEEWPSRGRGKRRFDSLLPLKALSQPNGKEHKRISCGEFWRSDQSRAEWIRRGEEWATG